MHRALLIFPAMLAFAATASAQQVATLAPQAPARTAEDLLTTSVLPVAAAVAQEPAVVKAAQNLRPGMVLSAADLIVEGDHPASPDAPNPLDLYVGQEVKRAIYVGKTMSLNDVGPPTAVERNAIVMLEFIRGPMTITTEGRALDAGAVGDRVRIMNLSSKIILTGTITGPNKAVTR